MVRCSFTKKNIEPGTGKMFVRKDGTVLWFINSKAQKNFFKLKREARFLKWTRAFQKGEGPKKKEAEVKKTENTTPQEAKK